ncbi:MAG: HNH endonuclease [Planctomyces sp.]|nr:HNH endonuclease [Planctomyces sp.]MBA4119162.1 HNH endonuclease [Isosphaera sp.]
MDERSHKDQSDDHPRWGAPPADASAGRDHGAPPLHPLHPDDDGALDDDGAFLTRYGTRAPAHAAPTALDSKVLVLNKLYMAIRVISARRAFTMLVRDLAEVVQVDQGAYVSYDFASWSELSEMQRRFEPQKHDWVRTVRIELAVPRIIRLLGYDRLPAQTVKLNRRNLFARDRNQCQYCGRYFPTSDLSIDHVVPRSLGGGDSWENLVCACIRCNARKGGRTPDQARMKMVRRPVMPRRNPLIALRLGQDKYASWKTFLDHAYWSVELK